MWLNHLLRGITWLPLTTSWPWPSAVLMVSLLYFCCSSVALGKFDICSIFLGISYCMADYVCIG